MKRNYSKSPSIRSEDLKRLPPPVKTPASVPKGREGGQPPRGAGTKFEKKWRTGKNNKPIKNVPRKLHPSVFKHVKNFKLNACKKTMVCGDDDNGFTTHTTLLTLDDVTDPDTTQMARSLVSNDTIYTIVLSTFATITTGVTGVYNVALDNDPSGYTEYSSLTALFSLVRIRRSEYKFNRAIDTAAPTAVSVGGYQPMAINALLDNAGAPGSYAAIIDSPDAKLWNYAWDTSKNSMVVSQDFTGTRTPLWADTSVPASTTLYQGCPGCCQIYLDNATPSIMVSTVWIKLTLEFMNRI